MSQPSHEHDALFERLAAHAGEFRELEQRLADPATAADPNELRKVSQRYHQLQAFVDALATRDRLRDDIAAASELAEVANDDDRAAFEQEVLTGQRELDALALHVRELLIPPDPDAGRNVIVEIRGAEGGEEANLFAGDLLYMYRGYAQLRGWKL
ncbi:MAG: PCRF domain-containing protein, partial [Actinomycetota bacterium]|nr:PCRF domain-containing protein [Actinomycetota bacterium]